MERKIQNVFMRHENKYFLDDRQFEAFKSGLSEYLVQDAHPSYTICNIYFDTDDFLLARRSIEKPKYKEKLRLRSYGVPKTDDLVFAEIKKKYNGVVYKRRTEMTNKEASDYFLNGRHIAENGQIMHEIDYFMRLYRPAPKVFIAYDRTAYHGREDRELRVTFDRNIRWRGTSLDLSQGDWGTPLLRPGLTLMELKTPGAVPLWLSHMLSELRIYPTSYSKYGACYTQYFIPSFQKKGDVNACA